MTATPATASDPAAQSSRGARVHGRSFWVVAIVFATAMAFSTIPTPLYAFYRERDGFSTFWITVIFAAYAIGVIASLFLAGHISDWFGRRPLLLAALATEIVAAGIFLVWPALPGLIVARIVTGIGVGLITATATAQLGELHAAARPGAGPARAQRISVVANMGGLALGPLVAGVLAQFVPSPLVIPFVIFVVLLVASAVLVLVVPETVSLTRPRPAYRPQRITIPQQGRPLYFTVAAAAFVSFAILGLFTSVSPGFLASLGHHAPLLAGAVTFAVFGAGAAAQIAVSSLAPSVQVRLGLAVMAAGILIVTVSVGTGVLAGFVAGGVIAGSGVGTLFKGALATAAGLAEPQSRGEALAGLFLAAYIGLALPVMGIGVATLWVSLSTALLGFAVLVLAAIAAVALQVRSLHHEPATA